MVNHKSAKQK